ncbi:MAG: hypothetical protein WCY07_03860 [Pigmentiphaga sp.]
MPSLTRSSVLKTGLAGVFLSLLAACAGPSSIQLGTPVQQVLTQQGQATLDYPRPGGGQRFIWSGQPMGQFTWITDTDAQGLVIDNFQALTSERFTQLDHGEWDSNRVMFEFGPPAEISRVGLRGEHIVWSYRFREQGVWNSLMHVHFDHQGKLTKYYPGPDPLWDPRERLGL